MTPINEYLDPKIAKRIQNQLRKTDDFEVNHLKELLQSEPSEVVTDEMTGSFEFQFRGRTYKFVSRMGMLITGEYNGKKKNVNEMAQTFKWI